MLIFCKVHVQRNFTKRWPTYVAKYEVDKIWGATSKEDLYERMDSICSAYPELETWIESKKTPWILAGLSPDQSRIDPEWWTYARKHTSLTESSHFQDNNYTGKKLNLLVAVLRLLCSQA